MSGRLFIRLNASILLAATALMALLFLGDKPTLVEAEVTTAYRVNPPLTSQTSAVTLPQVIKTVQFPAGIDLHPWGIAVNPTTGYAYVLARRGTAVISRTKIITTLAVSAYAPNYALSPSKPIAANPVNGYVYAVGFVGPQSAIYMISGTQIITAVNITADQTSGYGVAVNPSTGYAYVSTSGGVTIISGTQIITTLAGYENGAIDVNARTGYVYLGSGKVLSGTSVVTTVAASGSVIGINPVTNYAYYLSTPGDITILSGTEVISTGNIGGHSNAIDVNPTTGYVYIALSAGSVQVLSGTQWVNTVSIERYPADIGINPKTGYVYVANRWSSGITILSGTQYITTTPADPYSRAIGVNPKTGYVYAVNYDSNNVNVLSGTQVIATIAGQRFPAAAVTNPATGYTYLANQGSNDILVLTDTEIVTALSDNSLAKQEWFGLTPSALAVNPATGYVYVANNDSASLTVISGTQIITHIWPVLFHTDTVASGFAIGVNSKTGYVYVATSDWEYDDEVMSVLSGTEIITRFIVPVPALSTPTAIGVNPTTGYSYLADYQAITVLSATEIVTQLKAGMPVNVGVNPVSGYVYVGDAYGKITVVSETQVITAIPFVPSGNDYYPLGVNTNTGLTYVTNWDDPGTVMILSATQTITSFSPGSYPNAIAVDTAQGYAYIAAMSGLLVLSGTEISEILPMQGQAMSVNPQTGLLYSGYSRTWSSRNWSQYRDSGIVFVGQPKPLDKRVYLPLVFK